MPCILLLWYITETLKPCVAHAALIGTDEAVRIKKQNILFIENIIPYYHVSKCALNECKSILFEEWITMFLNSN